MQKKVVMQEIRDKKIIKPYRKQRANDRGNSFYMSNYITCKQIKLSSPKTGRMMHMMQLFAIYKRLILDPKTEKS